MVAPAAAGCKRLLAGVHVQTGHMGNRVNRPVKTLLPILPVVHSRALRHRDEAIRGSDADCSIVGAEIGNRTEAALRETGVQLATCPTPHDKLIIAGAFLTIFDQGVPLGLDKPSVLSIEFRDARERQLAPLSVNTLSEDRLPSLARG
jgi:hypothetical protein